ncbi:hypothetical protein TCAL_03570 [Tigriopus californicus]|uniref:Protein KTI12 homolog n=1 Tax=Tigriopus californicus TaxID=6832 RepID=A0A553NG07_TIGCA|nr:protein KTI12 homolog [Tigriopus californicus]TRY64335.1 hypothetical protein TCAL_03570 [Tigriopus californicus]|eukprot:TCALIF_03570-PA protein Name:"Similar to kti12 Protein KTI12 homolog (Xenopus laevis)" AED:0.01 eAED:0.01 QI:0/-1/0/1/-1/1/1/0/277
MPLVVVTGYPSSGKTRVTDNVRQFFQKQGKVVTIVSENEILKENKNSILSDSLQEKRIRGTMKSEVTRLIHGDHVVILDALNYIKGFRYELYCVSKASKTTQCTIHCDVSPEDAWQWNQERSPEDRYDKDVFDALVMRYEAPMGHNRWDAPLLLHLKDIPLVMEHVNEALFQRKAPPPNQSTQCQPMSTTNFVHELNRITKEINLAILDAQKSGAMEGDSITLPGTSEKFILCKVLTMSELARVKRQFITYIKARAIEDLQKMATMFVQYLNTSLVT